MKSHGVMFLKFQRHGQNALAFFVQTSNNRQSEVARRKDAKIFKALKAILD